MFVYKGIRIADTEPVKLRLKQGTESSFKEGQAFISGGGKNYEADY